MRRMDRFILGAIAIGIWMAVAMYVFIPFTANAIDTSDIDDFRRAVRRIVENCSVYGEVSIYDLQSGEIDGGYISC